MSDEMDDILKLPPEVRDELAGFIREENGEAHVADREGFVKFILKNFEKYPALGGLLAVNESALVKHFEETGEVPAGVRMVGKVRLSDKVTKLEILTGPIPPRPKG